MADERQPSPPFSPLLRSMPSQPSGSSPERGSFAESQESSGSSALPGRAFAVTKRRHGSRRRRPGGGTSAAALAAATAAAVDLAR